VFGRETLKEFMRGEQEKTRRALEEVQEKMQRALEETREFNREILLRNEKVYTAVITEMEENTKQIRANTEGVLRLLDRFDEPGGAAA
jgi:hypothetical protein